MEGLLPDFTLPELRGGRAGTVGLLQRRDLVLAVLDAPDCAECQALLRALDRRAAELESRQASALAVAPAPGLTPPSSFSCVVDAQGQVARAIREAADVLPGAWLVTSTRYGVVKSAHAIHGADPDRLIDDALGWIDFAQMECPECGAPVW